MEVYATMVVTSLGKAQKRHERHVNLEHALLGALAGIPFHRHAKDVMPLGIELSEGGNSLHPFEYALEGGLRARAVRSGFIAIDETLLT